MRNHPVTVSEERELELWNESLVQDRIVGPSHMEPVEMLSRGSNSWSWLEKVLIDLVYPPVKYRSSSYGKRTDREIVCRPRVAE